MPKVRDGVWLDEELRGQHARSASIVESFEAEWSDELRLGLLRRQIHALRRLEDYVKQGRCG